MAGVLDVQALLFADGEPHLGSAFNEDDLADLSDDVLESLGTASPEMCSTEWLAGVKCLLNRGESALLLRGCTVDQAAELSQPHPAEEQATRTRFAKRQTLKPAVMCRPNKVGNLKSDVDEPAGVAFRIYVERGVSERVVLGLIEGPVGSEENKLKCIAATVCRVGGEDSELEDEASFKSVNNKSPLRCEWDWYSTAWQKRDAQKRTLRAVFVLIEPAGDPANLGALVLDTFTHFFWPTHDGRLPGAHLTLLTRALHL